MTDRIPQIITDALRHAYLFRPVPEFNKDTDLCELGADSLTRQCIAADLDETFGFIIPDAEIAKWECVRDIYATVESMRVAV